MKTLRYVNFVLAGAMAGVMLAGCGSSSKMTTPQQKQAANRGAKLDKEECEDLAMQESKNWRASGNGVSAKESFAKSMAELDAKTRLARQLEEQINGLIRNFNQQHEAGGAQELVGKGTELQEGYVDKILSNVRTICNNSYVKPDGSYNVYVCVEMSEQGLSAIHKKLTADQKLSIDFAEHQFKKDMEKAKADYRDNQ
jgi:uncharacterized protein YceK